MASIRLARSSELHELAIVAMRAFAHDPIMTYMTVAPKHFDRVPLDTPPSLSTLDRQHRILYYFLDGLARGTLATNGRVTVAVVPTTDEHGQPGRDRIVGLAYWLAPGAHMDSLRTIIEAKQHRFILGDKRAFLRGAGLTGLKRAVVEFQKPVDAVQARECNARGIDTSACWHLQLVCVDPDFEGQGLCSKLMREHFTFAPDASCLLEASTAKSRDVYLHYGFEITGEIILGAGKVNSDGIPVSQKKEKAVGTRSFAMVRVPSTT